MVDSSNVDSGTPALRICVVGAGAIGGFLACLLARAGHAVSVIARGAHLKAIQRNGLILASASGAEGFTVQVKATHDLSEVGPQDLIFLALKAHDIPEIAPRLSHALSSSTVVVPTVNGIPWWYFHGLPESSMNAPIASLDPAGNTARYIDTKSIIGCVVRLAAAVIEPGVIEHTQGKRLILGEPSGESSERLQRVCTVLQDAGLEAEATPRIRDEIWAKLVGNLSTNPLSALTHAALGELCESPALVSLMRQLMDECRAVGTAYGIHFTSDNECNLMRFRSIGATRPSMLQDIEKGRQLEIPAILESTAELARRASVATPSLEIVLALIAERARHLS
jgi:2-dehydropantoate 2-reductase